MPWITITVDDLKDRLAGPELEALQTAALAESQSDPVTPLVTQVIDEVRGYVAAAGVALGDGVTIPSKLKNATLNIIRFRIASRLPLESFMTESRKQEYRDARALLEAVAARKFIVEEPETPALEQSGILRPLFDTRPRNFSLENQEGL